MALLIYLLAVLCLILGAVGLVGSWYSNESDGSKLIARVIRAVGFLLLAGLLKSFAPPPNAACDSTLGPSSQHVGIEPR